MMTMWLSKVKAKGGDKNKNAEREERLALVSPNMDELLSTSW